MLHRTINKVFKLTLKMQQIARLKGQLEPNYILKCILQLKVIATMLNLNITTAIQVSICVVLIGCKVQCANKQPNGRNLLLSPAFT